MKQFNHNVLLLSRVSLLPRRKVYGTVGSSMPIRRCQFRGGEGLVSEHQSQHRDVGAEQQARLIRHIWDAEFVPATGVSRRMES